MDNDDLPIGRVLSRREALVLFGAAGATFLAACSSGGTDNPSPSATSAATNTGGAPTPEGTSTEQTASVATATTGSNESATMTPAENPTAAATSTPVTTSASATKATVTTIPSCIVVPELTEGPYFVDELLDRSDIRSDPSSGAVSEGSTLELTFRVSQINGSGCSAFAGAIVDIWHCDALGVYSDVTDGGFDTVGQQFLRGYQVTGDDGIASFTTIYPGWYQGRTVHIHFKVRSDTAANSALEFTSQLFFDEEFSDEVYVQEPYAAKGERGTRNDNDGIFQNAEGLLTLACIQTADGYASTFDLGIQVS